MSLPSFSSTLAAVPLAFSLAVVVLLIRTKKENERECAKLYSSKVIYGARVLVAAPSSRRGQRMPVFVPSSVVIEPFQLCPRAIAIL